MCDMDPPEELVSLLQGNVVDLKFSNKRYTVLMEGCAHSNAV